MSPRMTTVLPFLLFLARFVDAQSNPCISFGKDFQDQGSYFQNSQSDDDFTFVQEFEGCEPDSSDNILVDPNGDQYLCSATPLTPDDTPELSTCPIEKSELFSGEWSIVILSNNGNGTPIAYQRDFSLSVGPQQTLTYTPTVTVTVSHTPIVNSTVVVTDTTTSTGPTSTTTVPSTTITKTTTITPKRVTTTTTSTVLTITKTKPVVIISKTTSLSTASCKIPPKQNHHDPFCSIKATVAGIRAANPTSGAKFRALKGRVAMPPLLSKEQFIETRHKRIAHLVKRAPDQPTSTVTDTNTADYGTITSTSTAPTITITMNSTTQVTDTITPSPVVVISGKSTAPVVTTIAPTPTRTVTKYAILTSWVTTTWATTITITSTTTPSTVLQTCTTIGGSMV